MENQIQIIQNGVGTLPIFPSSPKRNRNPFIEANSIEVEQRHLAKECIIPVFAKDNERTISHQEFIDCTVEAVGQAISGHHFEIPEIRVSHQIKGRTPEAIHKPAKDLLDHEKTIYYERMAFLVRIPSLFDTIGGNELELSFGGVRSYNLENLYQKKGKEKFKFFIGFQNQVCCNLCVSTDGFKDEILAFNTQELTKRIISIVEAFQAEKELRKMEGLTTLHLSESQFAQVVGKCRMYQYLPKERRGEIPTLSLNDGHFNTVAKEYYSDDNFKSTLTGDISLWKFYNLLTQANKSSYIDKFLSRTVNSLDLALGISEAIENENSPFNWYLS